MNPIDAFVQARLESERIWPARPARRPRGVAAARHAGPHRPAATQADLDAFLNDESPEAFGAGGGAAACLAGLTDQRMASEWLDVARFADTYGRHEDEDCETWPYRDWVVRAFNQNLPYDKFVLWQTAGDMLPGATQDMYLATAFNRLVQQSNESGSNEEEFRCEHVADRVRTNGIALLGLSIECARCHDHKYDPITQRDYYSLSAFLNNIDELGLYSRFTDAIPAPSMFLYEGEEEQRHLECEGGHRRPRARTRASMLPDAKRKGLPRGCGAVSRRSRNRPGPLAHLEFETVGDDKSLANSAGPGQARQYPLETAPRAGAQGQRIVFQTRQRRVGSRGGGLHARPSLQRRHPTAQKMSAPAGSRRGDPSFPFRSGCMVWLRVDA